MCVAGGKEATRGISFEASGMILAVPPTAPVSTYGFSSPTWPEVNPEADGALHWEPSILPGFDDVLENASSSACASLRSKVRGHRRGGSR